MVIVVRRFEFYVNLDLYYCMEIEKIRPCRNCISDESKNI